MDENTVFLTLEQILLIHEDQIDKYGGGHGVRDFGLLESAIMRPQTSFGGVFLYVTIFEKATALMHSLLLNHPFLDGNKRTATVAVLAFLEINEFEINATQKEIVNLAHDVENKKMSQKKLITWLKKHSRKI